MAELSIEARMPTEEAIRVVLGSWYPDMPPKLVGESPAEYTDRLTGADRMGWEPYDHKRNRQCAIGFHDECSDPAGESCKCPCHRETVVDGAAEKPGVVMYRLRLPVPGVPFVDGCIDMVVSSLRISAPEFLVGHSDDDAMAWLNEHGVRVFAEVRADDA